ncbi:hypothetical protein KBA27_06920 [bacterium]|nr:hypothetical protein [bacterium]
MKKISLIFALVLAFSTCTNNLVSASEQPVQFDGMPQMDGSSMGGHVPQGYTGTRKSTNSFKDMSLANPLYPPQYTPEHIKTIKNTYSVVGKNEVFYVALDMLKDTCGDFSRRAILGNNLTGKPVRIEFKDLSSISKNYSNFDALGWKRKGHLYIYINQKHTNAPAIALSALLAHEALHQDELNSLSEETYAWTMEAAVWCQLLDLYPHYSIPVQALVQRENTLKTLFKKGNYTNRYIKKTVYSNSGYRNLPETSPGFDTSL